MVELTSSARLLQRIVVKGEEMEELVRFSAPPTLMLRSEKDEADFKEALDM